MNTVPITTISSKSENLLITGSEGLIGRLLVKRLHAHKTVRLDRVRKKEKDYVCADISDYEALSQELARCGRINSIVHLAGSSSVDAEWESVLKHNIVGTRNIFELARQQGAKVVFASSNHVTGEYETDPPSPPWKNESPVVIGVDMPVRPDGYYAVSKLFGEVLGRYFSEAYGISVICLRIGSVLENDNPEIDDRFRSTWLSHDDLVQLVRRSLEADIPFGIYYGVSNNTRRFWDISNAERDLKYRPKDNAELRFT